MRRVAGGDHGAFAILVRRYVRGATLLAAQLTGDGDEAEDIAQQELITALERARAFDATQEFRPWLYGIVRRIAARSRARRWRRRGLWTAWMRPPVRGSSSEPSVPSPESRVHARIALAAVRDAMRTLPPMQRACLELWALRGLEISEISDMHGVAESTVRQHLFRARQALRSALGDWVEGEEGEGPSGAQRNANDQTGKETT